MERIPVHIVTGYLGAGKTTFLNKVINHQSPDRMMVIENEVGKTNIDRQLVVGADLDVVELTSGCLCCSLNNSLLEVLEAVSHRRDEFDRLIIETTGVADPESIVLPFVASNAVERVFDLQNTICLVDAKYFEEWITETEEAKRQVTFADVLLINKADLVTLIYLEELKQILNNINPYANIYVGQNGDFPVDEILAIQQLTEEGAVKKVKTLPKYAESHVHGVSTFTLTFDHPFNLDNLVHELFRMVRINRHQIYRIKGIINANDYPVQVILQSVRDTIMLTDGGLWGNNSQRESKIVFIGKNITKHAIERIFQRHLVKTGKMVTDKPAKGVMLYLPNF